MSTTDIWAIHTETVETDKCISDIEVAENAFDSFNIYAIISVM